MEISTTTKKSHFFIKDEKKYINLGSQNVKKDQSVKISIFSVENRTLVEKMSQLVIESQEGAYEFDSPRRF